MIFCIRTGWMGNGPEAIIVEAGNEGDAIDQATAKAMEIHPDGKFTLSDPEDWELPHVTELG